MSNEELKRKNIVKNNNYGITLVALVVTIIVLLILAGISISMVLGNNGVIHRAADATANAEKEKVYEQIKLATASGEIEYYYTGTDRLNAYKNELLSGVDGIDRDNLTDNGTDLITGTVTSKSGKQYDFSVSVINESINVDEHNEYPLASTILKVNPNGETLEEKGPYINYHYKENDEDKTLLCRLLYDADSEYGIQITTEDVLDDFQIRGNQYNDAVKILNNNSAQYLIGNDIADRARSIGSNPNSDDNSEGTSEMFYSTDHHGGNGIYKDLDEEYDSDVEQLTNIGDRRNGFWLASRYAHPYGSYRLGIRTVELIVYNSWSPGDIKAQETAELIRLYSFNNYNGDDYAYYSVTKAYRPVFHLKSGTRVVSGNGTKDSPYELSL